MTLIFCDTETTMLEPRERREPWEIGLVVEGHPNPRFDGEWRWFVRPERLDLADPNSLRFARYYERTQHLDWNRGGRPVVTMCEPGTVTEDPRYPDVPKPAANNTTRTYEGLAATLAHLFAGAHVIGAVPSFDEDTLRRFLMRHGQQLTNHYHIVDIESLALGWMARGDYPHAPDGERWAEILRNPPYSSDVIWEELGVQIPVEERHTALGDARQVRRAWRVVAGQDEQT